MRAADPNNKIDPLLKSAIRILNDPNRSFDMNLTNTPEKAQAYIKAGRRATDPVLPVIQQPGEEIMTKALADQKAAERKQFLNKPGRAKPPKHKPAAQAADPGPGERDEDQEDHTSEGVDTPPQAVAQSGFPSLNQLLPKETPMTTETQAPGTDGVAKAAQIKAEAEAVKAAKKAEREAAQAAKKAERVAAAQAAERVRAAAKAAKDAEKAAALEARQKELAESGSKRTYVGSMLTLADKVKEGVYVKGKNGQLRSNDELAVALEVVEPKNVVALCMAILGEAENKYAHLNIGQQSMNYRNRLRGVIRKGGEGAPTVADVIAKRDELGFVIQPKAPKAEAKPAEAAQTEQQAETATA